MIADPDGRLEMDEAAIRAALLPLGFTEHVPGTLYDVLTVAPMTTLNTTVDPSTGEYRTLVLDEHVGQPALYMNAREDFRDQVVASVNARLAQYAAAGAPIAHEHNQYSRG